MYVVFFFLTMIWRQIGFTVSTSHTNPERNLSHFVPIGDKHVAMASSGVDTCSCIEPLCINKTNMQWIWSLCLQFCVNQQEQHVLCANKIHISCFYSGKTTHCDIASWFSVARFARVEHTFETTDPNSHSTCASTCFFAWSLLDKYIQRF